MDSFILCPLLKNDHLKKNLFIFERDRDSMSGGGEEREGERES